MGFAKFEWGRLVRVGTVVELAQAVTFRGVGPHDPGGTEWSLGRMHPALIDPLTEFPDVHPQFLGQILQQPFMGTELWRVQWISKAWFADQFLDHGGSELAPLSCHAIAFTIQHLRNLWRSFPLPPQFHQSLCPDMMILELRVCRHATDGLVLTCETARPVDRHVDNFRRALNRRHHLVDDATDDLLSLFVRGGEGLPERRNIRAQRQQLLPFLLVQ